MSLSANLDSTSEVLSFHLHVSDCDGLTDALVFDASALTLSSAVLSAPRAGASPPARGFNSRNGSLHAYILIRSTTRRHREALSSSPTQSPRREAW